MKNVFILLIIIFHCTVFGKPYRAGELRTIDSFRYGRFEVRMKSAAGTGVISSFFTYHDFWNQEYDNYQDLINEIDIEMLGNQFNAVQFTTHHPGEWNLTELVEVGFNPHTEFNVYAIEWTPQYVKWFVNGIEVYFQDENIVNDLNYFHKIMMNIWPTTSTNWAGIFDPNNLSLYSFYDWVKYYSYVPGTGNTGTDNNFILLWEDPFDGWNTVRWEKATHTFDGNNADFIEENVVFQYGYMILCLTTPNNTGYNGGQLTAIDSDFEPSNFNISPPYPNPFNSSMMIQVTLQKKTDILVRIFDIRGSEVFQTILQKTPLGIHTLKWNGLNDKGAPASSGLYFLSASDESTILTQKLLLLR